MLRLENIKIREDLENVDVAKVACKKYKIEFSDVNEYSIFKKSVDARNKSDIFYNYTIDVKVKNEKKYPKVKQVDKEVYDINVQVKRKSNLRPVIIGAGPAGLFAAITFVENGLSPIIVEQGKSVDERQNDISNFINTGKLNPNSNVQFGEGGAGAFSDGKLTTRSKDSRARKVLEELVDFGAKEDILIDAHPHIGTDAFLKIIENCRKKIIDLGGTFYFDTCLKDIKTKQNKLAEIKINDTWIPCENMILTIGHSATDTIRMLHQNGVMMENKPYAIGVRIEHKQEYINRAMLKDYATDPRLIPARYQLTHTASNNKGVYTFCMCPGGYVIPSSSSKEKLVVNGMSYASRSGENANSAVIVTVTPDDFGSDHPLAGISFQRSLEEKAYQAGQGKVPVQRFGDFKKDQITTSYGKVHSCMKGASVFGDVRGIFPEEIAQSLEDGITAMDHKIHGFADNDALLSGVESRTSSPVRIERDENFVCASCDWIYPCGEGAGYAGGITSAAMDGMKVAEAIIQKYKS